MKSNKNKLQILIFILIGILGMHVTSIGKDHQKLEYNVAVSARIIPVFALDNNGKPVYDIQKDEIHGKIPLAPFFLKTISKPKIVFLISEGVQRGAILDFVNKEVAGLLLKYLKIVAQSVNEGGSILYAVNPRKVEYENFREDDASVELSLSIIARESGGKYFEGSDPVVIAKEI